MALVALARPVRACQNECVVVQISAGRVLLHDQDEKAISGARIIVRSANPEAHGRRAFCSTRLGPIVKKLRTDRQGSFDLKGLKQGMHWVTYVDRENGESFLIEVQGFHKEVPVLAINHFGGRCYLVDVERNVTKPPGWGKPVSDD